MIPPTAHAQSGAVMLLILLAMLTGGGLLMASRVSTSVPLEIQQDRSRTLGMARQALLSYAVGYIDLYGPRGAGPGHLPCPDTDPMDDAPDALSWLGDGPNPPCGHGQVALGRLPRHISLPGHRYGFHGQPRQELWYAVSTGFVNNPVNRVVNPASRGGLRLDDTHDIVALIIDPGRALASQNRTLDGPAAWLEGENADADAVFTRLQSGIGHDRVAALGMDSLRTAMTERVGLWLRDQARAAAATRCADTSHETIAHNKGAAAAAGTRQALDGPGTDVFTAPSCLPYALPCDAADIIHWLASSSSRCHELADPAASSGVTSADRSTRAAGNAALLTVASDTWMLEGVPWRTHWFVRNQWTDHANLQFDDACRSEVLHGCDFRLLDAAHDQPEIRLALTLRENETNGAATAVFPDGTVAR